MNKIKYLIIVFILLFSGMLQAQNTKVLSGRVFEMVNGEKQPIPGANVVVANNQNRFLTGVATGPNGEYNFRVPANEEGLNIIFSFIGLKSKKIPYTGQPTIDVVLESEDKVVTEVVVQGRHVDRVTGITEKQQTAATQRVDMDEIMSVSPVTSLEEALQGQLGGVDIISGGDPGAKSSIRIRGTSTLNASADPLIVIDGIPYSTTISDDFNFATANAEDFGQLINIAPTDIESIEVLKDAAATAIWGTKGGNGVLMITTKKGSKGKTRFTFSSKLTTRFEPEPIPLLDGNEYVALMQDAIWNAANAKGLANSQDLVQLLYDTPEINYSPNWRYFDEYNQNTDWLDEIVRTSIVSDNNFSMSGGGDKAIYRFSVGYLNDQGTTIGTSLDRFTSLLSINYNFSQKLRVDVDYSFTQTEKNSNYDSGSSSWRNARSEAMAKMPNKSPYWIGEDGERTDEYFSRQNSDEFQGAFTGQKNYNPVALVNEGYNTSSIRENRITFRLNYYITPELTYTGYTSMKLSSNRNEKFLPQVATGVTGVSAYANRSSDAVSDGFNLITENKLLYRKNWSEKHNLVAMGLFRTEQAQGSSYYSQISGAASAGLADPTTGGTVTDEGSGTSETRSMSGIANAHYTFMERYMVNATVNFEGNSSLGKSERWGAFPAVGLAWQAQEEDFIKNLGWVDQAKIRVSYGVSGRSPSGASPYIGSFQALDENYMDMAAIAPIKIQLDNLKWETSKELDFGADFIFMENKFKFTFDWYNKKTNDLLQKNVSVPASTGFTTIAWYNSGEITNTGIELRGDYEIYKNRDWRITVNANINRNVNKIVALPDNLTQESYTFGNGNYAQRLETGVPVGSFYGYKYEGVYQNVAETYARDAAGNIMNDVDGDPIVMQNGTLQAFPGDAKYKDTNNDGVINQYDIVYLGNSMPVFTGGGGFQVKYKSWTLTTFFHGRAGQKVINQGRMNTESMYGRDNQSTATLRRWRSEGDVTDIPRALYNYGYNYLGSDRFVEDASFIRLKTLSLSYNMPRDFVQKLGMQSLNVFLTGYDLFTWTKYAGQDPEVKMPSATNALVKDESSTPISRRFALGVNINF
ncbi:SusC/RagA family TonB-linked outer membrane protein [Mangrovibacterium diazotrophicum]|uniref:TonB-linked SusC/RagA family outer membrane protein n=1 Tax=Mangrovibacterium diazotrophicum TaxID=1261403 RepID=A0A419W6A8_9BACT|nr:SusC/RagA family TonB-linked outer membrane protein [Mangrovibacterium diazotrophicum]RKD90960.1 TonB-linked SusC/RagA family outer membrane protein [Mangrovibacterium diazotrophicum]